MDLEILESRRKNEVRRFKDGKWVVDEKYKKDDEDDEDDEDVENKEDKEDERTDKESKQLVWNENGSEIEEATNLLDSVETVKDDNETINELSTPQRHPMHLDIGNNYNLSGPTKLLQR